MKAAAPIAPLRGMRGTAFAGAALGLAVGAHRAGGGAVPGLVALVLLAVPVLWVSFFLTRAWRGWPVVVTSLTVVEAGLHEALSLLSGSAAQGAPTWVAPVSAAQASVTPGQMAMDGHAMVMAHPAVAVPSVDAMSAMPLLPSFGMIAAHLLATVLTGAVLGYGEHLLWSLWTWLRHTVTILTELVQPATPCSVSPAWLLTVNPVPVLVDRSVRRRGPPLRGAGLPAFT
jgi:hypothetical protein